MLSLTFFRLIFSNAQFTHLNWQLPGTEDTNTYDPVTNCVWMAVQKGEEHRIGIVHLDSAIGNVGCLLHVLMLTQVRMEVSFQAHLRTLNPITTISNRNWL
jgi:hypothetical protein